MKTSLLIATAMLGLASMAAQGAEAPVKITPLGSHDGEFCAYDRALILEDPDGTRILYDAGRTVRGADDPRLGTIDAVLLSHVHGDHLGDVHQAEANAGTCALPAFSVSATPNSNTVNIAVGKQAKLLLGGEMPAFFTKKVEAAGGDPGLVQLVRFGGQADVGALRVRVRRRDSSQPSGLVNGSSTRRTGGDARRSARPIAPRTVRTRPAVG